MFVIIHCDVLIIIRLLVFIIGKLCSRLSRIDSKFAAQTMLYLYSIFYILDLSCRKSI